jgi:hypothetical protein
MARISLIYLVTKKYKKHEEKLTTDFTGCTDLIGQKKVQKHKEKLAKDGLS